jgi:uncharacterized protein
MTNFSRFPLIRIIGSLLLVFLMHGISFASDKDFPPPPSPPRLVNDGAGTMSESQVGDLEKKLLEYEETSSIEISIVTIESLGDYEVADYAVELARRWGIGKKGKNNGVLILVSKNDHKINISTGYGLEGALTDAMCGRIIDNEMVPAFRANNYYEGFLKASDAIVKASKGEYTANKKAKVGKKTGTIGVLGLIVIIYIILWILSKIGGGGGNYMSGRGRRGWGGGFLGGFIGGSMLGGGGGGWGGGSSSGGGGGGFGGFGGGSFGGGGASGSW